MSCEDTTALLLDRFKGLASAADERRLEAHLASCADCRATAESITRLWTDLGTDDPGAPEHAVPSERMRARFHAALRVRGSGRACARWLWRSCTAWRSVAAGARRRSIPK